MCCFSCVTFEEVGAIFQTTIQLHFYGTAPDLAEADDETGISRLTVYEINNDLKHNVTASATIYGLTRNLKLHAGSGKLTRVEQW